MNNATTITVDLPPHVLDKLEAYVRAREAVFNVESRAGIQGMNEAEREEQKAAEVALLYLISEMRDLEVGTLGEALSAYWRGHDARSAALQLKYSENRE